MAFFDEMARTPGRLLNDAVRLASTRLPGRRIDVSVAGTTLPLRVERVDVEGVEPDIETSTDALIDMAFRLSESAARNMLDPLAFGNEAVDTFAGALADALGSAPARALRGEIDIASAVSARLGDIDEEGGGTDRPGSTATIDIGCGPVTGRLGNGVVISAVGVAIAVRVRADSIADWLRRLGVGIGPSAEVVPCDDGRLRIAIGADRFGLLRRLARLVGRPALVEGTIALTVDSVEILGLRLPLPRRLRREVSFDPSDLRDDLEVRELAVTSGGVSVEGWLPRVVHPVSFEQIDAFRSRLARPADDEFEVRITHPHPPPGSRDTPTAGPASGTR